MPGAHSYTIQLNLTNFTLNHGPGSIDSAGRKVKVTNGARAATAGPCCSCQQGSPRKLRDNPGAHGNEQGAGKCKTERGKMMWAVGMAWQRKAVAGNTAGR